MSTTVRLAAADPAVGALTDAPAPDAEQVAAVGARGRLVRVLGGPGTGTSTVAVGCVVDRVRRGERRLDEIVLVGPTRQAAARLRDAVTARTGGTGTRPRARTMASLGFGILRQQASLQGRPAPRLLSGADQDVVIADLLAGHAAGEGAPGWPPGVTEALGTRGFRDELRDLLMRSVEHGLGPADLARLGEVHDRPEWLAAARVAAEYDEVTALSRPGAYDPAWVLTAAADLLEDDPEAADRVAAELRCVVVDDAQELTAPAARLLGILAGLGADLVLLGDPDAAVQTFRGARPEHLVQDWPGIDGPTHVLRTGHRLPAAVAAADARVVSRIGALGGGGQRPPVATAAPGEVEVAVLRSSAQEAAWVAQALRRAHLVDGVPWSELAVVVRGAGRLGTLRRVLAARGVPVDSPAGESPVHEEPAARPLLTLLRICLDLAQHGRPPVVEDVVDVLTSPLLGSDAVALRRARRVLRAAELESGGARTSDELLTAAVTDPTLLAMHGPEVAALARLAAVVAAGVAAAAVDEDGRWAPGVTGESVLWALWSAVGVADAWREQALAGASAGRRADRLLDGVVALLDAAAAHQDALPAAGPDSFLAAVGSSAVAADSLAARGDASGTVALLTPQSAAGREWRRVVVAGVQEGVWPDLRLRGSLLGSEHLVDVLTGRDVGVRAAREKVRDDETRLLHVALTRATESVHVTAVSSEDEQPSVYLDLIDPRGPEAGARESVEAPLPLDLVGVVARLRQDLAGPAEVAAAAARRLTDLHQAGVRGADPGSWWALRGLSDDRPVRPEGTLVPVSPSRVDGYQRCPLRWLLTSSGGDGVGHVSSELGTLIHAVAEELGDVPEEEIHDEIDRRWPQLGQRPGWVADQNLARAHAMGRWLARYYQQAAGSGWTKVGAEVPFAVEVGRARLAGRVDRVERDADGRLRVVDYKTGSSAPTKAELAAHPQLGTYQVAVEAGGFPALGRESGGAAIVNLGKAANPSNTVMPQPPTGEADDPAWAQRLVAETAEGMAAARFVARPDEGKVCGTCPVRTSCPARDEGMMLR